MTPPVKDKATALTAPYRKDFSLTSGAKFLEIGKGTLRSAIERGEVKATKNAAGHYIIEGAQIFQYEANLKADQLQDVSARAGTGDDTLSDTSAKGGASTGVERGVSTGVERGVSTGVDALSDRRAGTVSSDMHRTVVEMMEARLRDKDGTIRNLENSVESWKTQAKSWQNHADNNLRLLTDERTKSEPLQPDINLESEGQGGHVWRNTIAAAALAGLVVSAFYFRAEIAQQWAKLTTSDASAATAIESEIPQG